MTLAIPIGILVFFAKVDAVTTDFKDPVDFLVPGVLALAVMSTAMVSLGIATGFERRYGVLKRLGSTPLSRGGLLAAKTVNVLAIEVVQAVVIIVTGIALGWELTGGDRARDGCSSCSARSRSRASGCSWPAPCAPRRTSPRPTALFLVLLFLGGMAYPLDKLPTVLEEFAKVLPAAALSRERARRAARPASAFPGGASWCSPSGPSAPRSSPPASSAGKSDWQAVRRDVDR